MTIFGIILATFLALVLLLLIFEIAIRFAPNYKLSTTLPGLQPAFILSTLKFVSGLTPENTFALLREWASTHKQTYGYWVISKLIVGVIRAHEMEIVLASSKHTQKGVIYELLRPFMGDGLLNTNGKKWQQRRRILTPTFHFSILQQFLAVFREEGKKLVKILEQDSMTNNPTALAPITSRFTLNTISETSMGVKLDALEEADEYREQVYGIGELLLERFLKPWFHHPKTYRWSLLRLKMDRNLRPVHAFTRNVIKKRRECANKEDNSSTRSSSNANGAVNGNQSDAVGGGGDGGGGGDAAQDWEPSNPYDRIVEIIHDKENVYAAKKRRYAMLDTLLVAEAKGEIDAEGIREEVDTFMFEGHDTTAAGLVFILFLLGQHKEVQQKVYEEVKGIVDEAEGCALGTTDFNNMVYTDRVIKESMRLYPPVPFISRDLTEDIRISSGHLIPKGTPCHLHIFDLHRDPEQFPDPERFDPDRFLPEECEKRHPFAYLPFSAGPRNCIGQKYAMLEMKSCLTDIIMNYTIQPVTKKEEIVFIVDIVLRTLTPVKVQFVRRRK